MRTNRRCSVCGEDFTAFKGRMYYCPDCEKAYKKAYREKNQAKIKEYSESYFMAVEEVEEKECNSCKELLPAHFFDRDSSKKSNLYSYCKGCRRSKKKELWLNPESSTK